MIALTFFPLSCSWSASPSCFTYLMSATTGPASVYSILECAGEGGLGTLFATPPNYSATSPSSSKPSTSQTATSVTSSTPSTSTSSASSGNGDSGGSSLPIGAIVGGALGGLALIIMVTFMVLILMRRTKKTESDNGASAQPQQNLQPPPGDYKAPTDQSHFTQNQAPVNYNAYSNPYAQSYATTTSPIATTPGSMTSPPSGVSPGSAYPAEISPYSQSYPVYPQELPSRAVVVELPGEAKRVEMG